MRLSLRDSCRWLTLKPLSETRFPGLGLPSEIIAIDPFLPASTRLPFSVLVSTNAQADLGDQQLVLGTSSFPMALPVVPWCMVGLPQLMVEALLAERQGLLPEGLTAQEIFRTVRN